MKASFHSRRREHGAVAIVFGLSLVVLFAMGGVVLDLGHLYVAKAELQNAADAAALAGAKELNEKAAGINLAVSQAQAISQKNKYNFSTDVILVSANIEFGPGPDGPWSSVAAAQASPQGKTFIKVDTGKKTMNTYLMRVAGADFNTVSTFGLAVAGRFVNNITPIGVCAIKDPTGVSRPKGEALPVTNELAQFGFRRGVSYNIFELIGPGFPPSNPYLLNPVDVFPNRCKGNNSSADNTAPFVCNGTSAILTGTPGTVYGNTGLSAGKIEAALNSRFNNYSGPSVCIPAQAPPDVNIQKFACTGGGCSTAADWMDPSQQTITPAGIPTVALPTPAGITSKNQYGVLWSYSRAVNAVGTSPNATPGAAFATSNWSTLYPAPGGAPVADADFPAAVSPYLDPAHITPPTVNLGSLNRRVLNIAIAD